MDLSSITALASHAGTGWSLLTVAVAWRLPDIASAVATMWHDWLDYRLKVKQLDAPADRPPPQALDVVPTTDREAA